MNWTEAKKHLDAGDRVKLPDMIGFWVVEKYIRYQYPGLPIWVGGEYCEESSVFWWGSMGTSFAPVDSEEYTSRDDWEVFSNTDFKKYGIFGKKT